MRRRSTQILTWTSVLLCLTGAAFWVGSRHTTNLFMVGWPGGRCILVTSHRGGWWEFTYVRNGWRERGAAAWHKDWRTPTRVLPLGADDRGPLKLWQSPSDVLNWGPPGLRGEFSLRRGTPAVMIDHATGRPLLDRTGGVPSGTWDNVAPGSPHWIFPAAWEVRVPHWAIVVLASVLPVGRALRGLGAALRRRLAYRSGCCGQCGYDLRATPERCPECGRDSAATATVSA